MSASFGPSSRYAAPLIFRADILGAERFTNRKNHDVSSDQYCPADDTETVDRTEDWPSVYPSKLRNASLNPCWPPNRRSVVLPHTPTYRGFTVCSIAMVAANAVRSQSQRPTTAFTESSPSAAPIRRKAKLAHQQRNMPMRPPAPRIRHLRAKLDLNITPPTLLSQMAIRNIHQPPHKPTTILRNLVKQILHLIPIVLRTLPRRNAAILISERGPTMMGIRLREAAVLSR